MFILFELNGTLAVAVRNRYGAIGVSVERRDSGEPFEAVLLRNRTHENKFFHVRGNKFSNG